MRILKNHKGFSLVEMIVVVAIIGILAGASIALFGHLRVANVDKTVQVFSMALNKLQLDSMSKTAQNKKFCVYLFRSGDVYYICRAKQNEPFNLTTMKANGTSLGGGITISTQKTFLDGTEETAVELGDGAHIMISYLRDGSLNSSSVGGGDSLMTFRIIIEGQGGSEIIINRDTGKLIVQ